MKSAQPTIAALVREQTGAAWSRARKPCTEGRVTVNGERCLDPASRVPADAVVVVDELAPKHRTGPLAEGTIFQEMLERLRFEAGSVKTKPASPH